MTLILIGCGSNEEKSIATLKDNTWIGKTCDILTQLDQNGDPHYSYYRSVYWFKENIIRTRISSYADKDCKNSLNQYSDYNLSYYNLGLKESKNGYDIYDIKIEERSKEQDALYAISHDRLCFSKSIYGSNISETVYDLYGNAYITNSSGLHIYTSQNSNIDYKNCLIKK